MSDGMDRATERETVGERQHGEKTRAALVDEQKRFKRRVSQSFLFVLLAVTVVILTIGEIRPSSNLPSWSQMLSQLGEEPQPEPSDEILMSVHAIDVGQGDCTLVRVGDCTILIDAGENGNGENVLEYLDDLGIKKLDYVIATHPHSDHIGGLDTVLYEMDVDSIIMPEVAEDMIPSGKTYSDFLDAAIYKKDGGTSIISAKPGKSFMLSDYAEMTILSPFGQYYSDLNDYSVAILITCKDVKFFSAGDITSNVEWELIEAYPDLVADLFKVSHHGSDASNHRRFVELLDADYAFISCGKNNSYGHPELKVLEILNDYDVEYRRTDIQGSFVYYTDGKSFYEG